jgi:hypothetical protein
MGPQNAHGVKRAEEHPRICQTTSRSKLWTVSERHERLVIQQQGVMEPDGREVAPVRRHIHQSECCSTGKSKLAGHARRIANTPGLAPRLPVVTRAHLSAFQFSRGRKDRLIRRPCCTSRAGRCVSSQGVTAVKPAGTQINTDGVPGTHKLNSFARGGPPRPSEQFYTDSAAPPGLRCSAHRGCVELRDL